MLTTLSHGCEIKHTHNSSTIRMFYGVGNDLIIKLLPSQTSGGLLLPSCMLQRDESSNKLWCTRPFLYATLNGVLRNEYLITLMLIKELPIQWHTTRYDGL